jgi:proline dehydrogenase
VLRGLGDPLQAAIARQDLRVRAYCPVGDLVAGMAYLVRRLLENTSNDSFLAAQANGVAVEELLAPPSRNVAGNGAAGGPETSRGATSPAAEGVVDGER